MCNETKMSLAALTCTGPWHFTSALTLDVTCMLHCACHHTMPCQTLLKHLGSDSRLLCGINVSVLNGYTLFSALMEPMMV